jgi:hypothetical protein
VPRRRPQPDEPPIDPHRNHLSKHPLPPPVVGWWYMHHYMQDFGTAWRSVWRWLWRWR